MPNQIFLVSDRPFIIITLSDDAMKIVGILELNPLFGINVILSRERNNKTPVLVMAMTVISLLTVTLWAQSPETSNPAETNTGMSSVPQEDMPTSGESSNSAQSVIHIVYQGPVSSRRLPDGSDAFVCTDGVYVYERQPQEDVLLELRARNAVVFYSQQKIQQDTKNLSQAIEGVYLEGDVVFQAGDYHITAEKLYYDFIHDGALVLDGVMRMVVPGQNIPLFLRADRIRQLSRHHFTARKIKLSTDEFHTPHVWMGADDAQIIATDDQGNIPATSDDVKRIHYDLDNFTANTGRIPLFWWPKITGSTNDLDAPLKSIHTSTSSEFGIGVESEWHLAGLMGLNQPKGVDATFHLDEFTKRGPGTGIDMDYTSTDYFGNIRSYLIDDNGEDRLAKYPARKDVDPPYSTRGRARWQHRQYLPLDWQGTFEVSYFNDPYFLESWEPKEFSADKEQETLMYFKQQRDNWAFDFLTKYHLNDFEYTQTQLPTAGFHVAGQDFFNLFTYHHNGYISRIGERAGERDVPGLSRQQEPWLLPSLVDDDSSYAFAVSRHEISMPLHYNGLHIAPTLIGTYAFDDSEKEDSFLQGAAGLRASTQFWHVDNSVHSRLWNLDRLRHIIQPEASVFWIDSDLPEHPNQDIYNFGVRQRWQTKRGPEKNKFNVDVLEWNTDVTLVTHDVDDFPLPNTFFFSTPELQFDKAPWINADFYNLNLARREQINQTVSDFTTSDWTWRVSDTTTVLGDINYNIHDAVISETNAGIAIQRTPRTSYYIGHQFLKNGDPFDDANSSTLTGGISYRLNRKYIVAFAHQFDIERTTSANTQMVIIRKFPHWYSAVSINMDPIRNDFSLSVSFWPEGYDKVALGSRRFTRLTR